MNTRHQKRAKSRLKPPPARELAIRKPISVSEAVEKVLIEGNLSPLTPEQRMEYYSAVCKSLGLNPLTKPFAYIVLNGKMVLYALRDCTEQLRRIHGVSVTKSCRTLESDLCVVEVEVTDRTGRSDTGTGAVNVSGLKGEALANAIMKTETKAKRRATLSICGLGMLDEAELDTMRGYKMVSPNGRVVETKTETWCDRHDCDMSRCPSDEHTPEENDAAMEKIRQSKLTPAQREVAERKTRKKEAPVEAPPPVEVPFLTWSYFPESETYLIDGPTELKSANKDLLKPLYVHPQGIVCDAQQLGKLMAELERRKVSIRAAERQPGE